MVNPSGKFSAASLFTFLIIWPELTPGTVLPLTSAE